MKKNLERLIKAIPIIINIYLGIVFIYSWNDLELTGSPYILGHSLILDILLLCSSYYHKFCSWHRVLIWNLIISSVIQYIDTKITITDDVVLYNAILMSVWCVLSVTSTILYFKYDWKNRRKKVIGAA